MKALLAPIGSRGDVQPMIALGQRLIAAGHEVDVLGSLDFRGTVEAAGFGFRAVEIDAREIVAKAGSAMLNPITFARLCSEQADAMIAACDRHVRDADIVVGGGAQGAARHFCEKRSIPYAYAVYCPVLLRSAFHPPPPVPWQTLPLAANRLTWWMTERLFHRFIGNAGARLRRDLGLPRIADMYDHMTRPKTILGAFDPAIAPLPEDAAAGVDVTGFWFADDPLAPDDELERFLAAGPEPVYVGFGSMPSSQSRRTSEIVLEAIRSAGVRAVISAGWAGLGDLALPSTCLRIGSVSHAKLFPRCTVIVHHGGSGTIAAAARAGVPQVVVPHLMDQYYFGHRVEKSGIGPRAIPIAKLSAAKLGAAITAANGSAGMRAAAALVASAILARPGADQAVRVLERASGSTPAPASAILAAR